MTFCKTMTVSETTEANLGGSRFFPGFGCSGAVPKARVAPSGQDRNQFVFTASGQAAMPVNTMLLPGLQEVSARLLRMVTRTREENRGPHTPDTLEVILKLT